MMRKSHVRNINVKWGNGWNDLPTYTSLVFSVISVALLFLFAEPEKKIGLKHHHLSTCQCSVEWSAVLTQIRFPIVQPRAAAVAGPPAIWQRAHCDFWLCASCWQTGREDELDYLLSFHEILGTRRSHKPSCEFTGINCNCSCRHSALPVWGVKS